jgi:hypothetical protein
MLELIKFAGVTVMALIAAGTLRIVKDFALHGAGRVREVREAGGGIGQKIKGELDGEDRYPSSSRAHGLYISVEEDGSVLYEPKSMIAREVV